MSNPTFCRSVVAVYADDIRQELDGKISIIGVYRGQMIFPSFPAVLPRMGIIVIALTPSAQPFEKLTFTVLMGSQVLVEKRLLPADLERMDSPGRALGDELGLIEIPFYAVVDSLQIPGPTTIHVRLETESGVLSAQSLAVVAASAGQ